MLTEFLSAVGDYWLSYLCHFCTVRYSQNLRGHYAASLNVGGIFLGEVSVLMPNIFRFFKTTVLFIALNCSVYCVIAAELAPLSYDLVPLAYDKEGLLFTLEGSNTIGAALAPAWVQAFLEAKGVQGVSVEALATVNEYRVSGRNGTRRVYIDIRAHGSTTGFVGLNANTANLAMASRAIKPDEVQQLRRLGDLLSADAEHVVGIDGLAVIVNPANPITQLTVDQIAQVFAGKLTNWSQLGGADEVISVHARDENSGTFDTFGALVLGKKYSLAKGVTRYESNDELSDYVAAHTNAIGFVGLASVRNARALAVSDGASVALKPEHIFVATEDYPLSRRLFIYSPEIIPNALAAEFVRFAQSGAGQALVEKVGFISQNPISLSIASSEGPVLYQAVARLGQRLSVNFRFQSGIAELDNKALRDVERLARYLNRPDAANSRVQLIGFSNLESSEKRAQVLSRLRAVVVKSALYRQGIRTESVLGFGDNQPVANVDGASALKNERVEVWLLDDAATQTLENLQREQELLDMTRAYADLSEFARAK